MKNLVIKICLWVLNKFLKAPLSLEWNGFKVGDHIEYTSCRYTRDKREIRDGIIVGFYYYTDISRIPIAMVQGPVRLELVTIDSFDGEFVATQGDYTEIAEINLEDLDKIKETTIEAGKSEVAIKSNPEIAKEVEDFKKGVEQKKKEFFGDMAKEPLTLAEQNVILNGRAEGKIPDDKIGQAYAPAKLPRKPRKPRSKKPAPGALNSANKKQNSGNDNPKKK